MTAERRTGIGTKAIMFWFGLMLGILVGPLWLIMILATNLAAGLIWSVDGGGGEVLFVFAKWLNKFQPFDGASENWGFRLDCGAYIILSLIGIISAF